MVRVCAGLGMRACGSVGVRLSHASLRATPLGWVCVFIRRFPLALRCYGVTVTLQANLLAFTRSHGARARYAHAARQVVSCARKAYFTAE
jgi:hypothetical protein